MNTLVASRSRTFSLVRQFFYDRGFCEVDVPILTRAPCIDLHIDPFATKDGLYLHTSPEIAMKRLLSQGSGDIFFLGHVFRKEERGSLHHSEFSMIEWYKTHTTKALFLEEIVALCSLFTGKLEYEILDYEEAFARFATDRETPSDWSPSDRRHYIWSHDVEPHLGDGRFTFITNYLKEDAALAQTHIVNGVERAERFEIYYRGIELGNGYYELSDPVEQRLRFENENSLRTSENKEALPLDEKFLTSLSVGLPPNTYGMSLGFDRLFLLKEQKEKLSEVLLLPDMLD
ncbi:MAG: EF-P lysine aminoacylase GenX [Verrucomicrobia bacterium]|nr:EF-P lysine aminoacylase GenX [Verrucomicrobiota bacterium]